MAAVDLTFKRPEQFHINDIGRFVAGIGVIILLVAFMAFFLYLVWGGAEWISSGGDKAKIQGARERIVHALIGLAILALTLAIVRIAEFMTGIPIIGDYIIPRAY